MSIGRKAASFSARVRKALSGWWRACRIKRPIDYVYAAFLFLATLLIVGMGPSLQDYVSTLLTSTESNIYDAAYRNAIQKFPDFAGWLSYTLDPMVVLASIAIWAAALATSRARTALIRSYVAAVISLTILDIAMLLFYEAFTFANISTCVASNIIGGFLVALIVVAMRSAGTYVAKFESQSSATKIVGLFVPLLIGAIISGSVFIVAKTMYDPAPVDFEAIVSPASWGYYRTDMPGDDKDDKAFALFGGQVTNNPARWFGVSSPLNVKWMSDGARYNLDVFISEGCTAETIQPDALGSSALSVNDIHSLSIKLDLGMAEYLLLPGEEVGFSASEDALAQFSVAKKEDKAVEFTMFASEDAMLSHSQGGTKRVFVSNYLLDKKVDSEVVRAPKAISFAIDGRDYSINFVAEAPSRPDDTPVVCTPIRAQFSSTRRVKAVAVNPMAGAVFVLTPVGSESEKSSNAGNGFAAIGAGGWVKLKADDSKDEGDVPFSEGATDFLVLSGQFDQFQVANAAMPTAKVNSLQAFGGKTNIKLNNDGVFHITGMANALYWNQERVNKTRWEKIDIGWATILISWLAGLLFLSYKGVRAALGSNYELGTPS